MTRFGPVKYVVKSVKGSMIMVIDYKGRELVRDRSWFMRKYDREEDKQKTQIAQPKPVKLEAGALSRATSVPMTSKPVIPEPDAPRPQETD